MVRSATNNNIQKYHMKSLITLFATTLVALVGGTATLKAECMPVTRVIEGGVFKGHLCVDLTAGTIYMSGVATLPTGEERTVEANATIQKTRAGRGTALVANGTATVTQENEAVTLNLSISEANITMLITTYTGRVIEMALP